MSKKTEDKDQPKPTPQLNERNSYIDELAKQRMADREREMAEDSDQLQETAEDIKDLDNAPETVEDIEEEDSALPAEPTETEEFVTLKIDGVEQHVPKSKVYDFGKRALQKELAADARLAEAARIKREAEEYARQVQTPDYLELAKKIQYGNEQDTAEALQQLATAPETEPDEIAAQVEFRLAMKEFQKPKEQGGFGDIWNDPFLRNVAINIDSELIQTGEYRDPFARVQEVGTRVRQWVSKLSGNQQPTKPAASSEDRKARKAAAGTPPTGGTAQVNQSDGPKEKTREEILSEMRSARHQS